MKSLKKKNKIFNANQIFFVVVLLFLAGIIGINFYSQNSLEAGGGGAIQRSQGNLLTGAIVGVQDLGIQTATSCWSYTSVANGCTSANGCLWKNDSWNPTGWCQELSCWSFNTQSECTSTPVPSKNCTWQGGGTSYTCEKVSCWSYSGTDSNSCGNNSVGLSCEWSNYCYSSGYNPNANCWNINNRSGCLNTTGCNWGQCMEKGCWSYGTSGACAVAKDWNGRNCTWNSGGWCETNGCWKYWQNASGCGNATGGGLNCEWKWDSCQEKDCYSWDFTNASACVNNTINVSCSWSGSWCMKQDCWSFTSNASCSEKPACIWRGYTAPGWCNEVNCWTWDSWNGGNQTLCQGNTYGLSCVWNGNPSGNNTNGWCYKDWSTTTCLNKTTERDCMDTNYCWWQYNNWNNVSAGGTCNTPGNVGWVTTNTSIFDEWNPGCYIFDLNSTDCNRTLGCEHNTTNCIVQANAYGGNITLNGINCSYINDSTLCNSLPVLSTCCAWNGSNCAKNVLSTSCRDQMTAPPEGAAFCEDYNAYASSILCNQIAGTPWYMPCRWDNSSGKCGFKSTDVFGNGTQSLVKIENKKSCEAAGGKWVTESYCEGNVSIPTGRCEYKFDEETNCDRACYACELKDSDGTVVNASNAKSACLESALGSCEFKADTSAPNGVGYCKAKPQFRRGMAENCDTSCGDCTFKGDKLSNDTLKRPSYYCTTSKANSAGGGCKWIVDNSTENGGYCTKKGEKTCEDACDRCTTQSNCVSIGKTAIANQSGGCQWSGGESAGSCVSTDETEEICWDGVDNTADGLIDCADPICYADSYCGFVQGNCFGWTTNETCINNSCEWIVDRWGSFCDFKGARCWKYDQNSSSCNAQTNCQWSNGTGGSWCEQDWSVGEVCMGLARLPCIQANASLCNWTVDTWCQGSGNATDWCRNNGGWCEYEAFKPKNCWQYTSGLTECGSHTGCSWHTDTYSQPHCEVNWSNGCSWLYDSTSCSNAGCWWRTDTWGSWCTNMMDKCWNSYDSATCLARTGSTSATICYWESSPSGGFCQPLCFNGTKNTNTACNAVSGCNWKAENGWCEESGMATCTNATNTATEASCLIASGCRWRNSGWCEPKGGSFSAGTATAAGGMGTAIGGDCYKYDGNQSSCTNKTLINISCSWMAETTPRCEVNWGKNCWQYTSYANGCNETNGCWLSGTNCMNIMDQCWNNASLQGWGGNANWAADCAANLYCINNSWGGCEAECASKTTAATCVAGNLSGNCRWMTGWCSPATTGAMFNDMESGAPVPLGHDTCNEAIQPSVDICGFGMKDMKDSFGFGMGVNDFSNASICNKEKLSSFVMGQVGGGTTGTATTFGTERIGSGNDTVAVLVYLDTDGSTTGGCALSHNSSAVGYEFRLKYSSVWNSTLSKAIETFNAYKCDDGDWKATDIKLSAWKKKMCSDMGGPMIAVEKADLGRFPSLYNSTRDLRISIATIGNTGNVSTPTDSAGPGWTTPGSIDFEIVNAFAYGANTLKFEDILRNGFVKGEDCFSSTVDNDGDGNAGCNDWDCQYSSACTNLGINAAGYTDTSSPLVTGVTIEEYPDAALIMYDTNKPTNGTLELYGADSQCLNRTDVIYDIGVLSANIRDYKLWHTAMIYDASNTNISLNYPLASNVNYYYKLKICDSAGKCSVSKCSSFRTASSQTNCGYCNFVTRIKVPNDWNVSYDINRDGVYEHLQGQVCGPNAGMKMNYTDGRRVNVKLAKNDGSVYMEFLNASLTKSGLNDKVRTISSAGDVIGDTAKVGLTSTTRDKIVNNLHPEVCRVKIPFSGTCDALYHCDDSGANCVDRTTTTGVTLLNATTCLWQIPYCEFSTYSETSSSSSGGPSSSGGGGGGGGGGGAGGTTTFVLTDQQFSAGYTNNLGKGDKMKFKVSGEEHTLAVDSLTSVSVVVNVTSKVQQAIIAVGKEQKFEVSGDNYYDLKVKVNSINATSVKASLTIKSISEAVPVGAVKEEESVAEEKKEAGVPTAEEAEELAAGEKKSIWQDWKLPAILIAILVMIVIIYLIWEKSRKE